MINTMLVVMTLSASAGLYDQAASIGEDKLDASLVAMYPEVSRSSQSLVIHTPARDVVFNDDPTYGEAAAKYRLVGLVNQGPSKDFIVLRYGWEGHSYELVNSVSGRKIVLPGEPITSLPYGRYLSFSMDLNFGERPNRLMIVRASDFAVELDINFDIGRKEARSVGPLSAAWVNRNQIVVVKKVVGKGKKDAFETVFFKYENGAWKESKEE